MAYNKTNWVNENEPAINADNLNKIEAGIEDNSLQLESYGRTINELNAPEKWVSVGTTAPTDGTRVWFEYSRNILPENLYMATRTLNGITYTNNGDGTISFSGTATANTSIQLIPDSKMSFKAGQPYYLYSSVPYNSTTFNLSIALTENGATRYLLANGTYTPTYNSTQARLSLYVPNGATISATNVKLMLIEGNTAPSEYEPYVAEHSIKIDNSTLIGQDNLVSVGANQPGDGKRVWFAKGKNLFDKSTATLGKGVNTSTGNLYNDSSLFTTDFIKVKTGGVYYTASGYSTSANRVYGSQYDSNKQYIGSIVTNAENKTFYISNASTKYIRLTGFISDIDTYLLEERKSNNNI